ncbi:LysM peptidoglycan-binding domain-containing protein [Salinarimonas chemoclinalis]|uniref:LysM peptidoglycan-binding domain-containing protein n=1 Tax=Salinarimonas chemoclinalis TaxID=3241599 RepID=UPI003557F393
MAGVHHRITAARALAPLALVLCIWLAPASARQAGGGCGAERVVVVGDTLTNVAQRCGVTPEALLAANPGIRDPDILPLGSTLVIPGGEAATGETGEGAARAHSGPAGEIGGVAPLRILPVAGPLDARVRLFARGLPPGAPALIGAGSRPDAPLFVTRAQIDATGVLSHVLALPAWTAGEIVHVVVETPIGGPWLRAEPWRAPEVRP